MDKPPSNRVDCPEDCPLQSRELSWLAMKCGLRRMDTGFESIAVLTAREPLSLRASAATSMSEKKLRILLAEGFTADTAAALRELYPEGQDGLELTNVSAVST